jgi:hypothetical protein
MMSNILDDEEFWTHLDRALAIRKAGGASYLQDSDPLPENGYTMEDDASQVWLEVNGYTVIIIKGPAVEGLDDDVHDKGIRIKVHKTDDYESLMKDEFLLNKHFEEYEHD